MLQEKIIGTAENGIYCIEKKYDPQKWAQDVPVFQGGKSDGPYSLGDNSFIVCINDADVTSLNDYTDILRQNGYREFAQNKIEKNIFYTFENQKNYIYVYYIDSLHAVKLIAEPYYAYTLNTPQQKLVKPAVVASSACDRNFYVRLPDGNLVVVDGGWRFEDRIQYDLEDLINEMYREMKEITGAEIIKIPLWIITHAHTDHVCVLENLYQLPVASKLDIQQILYNFADESHVQDAPPPTSEQLREKEENIAKYKAAAGVDFPYERVFYNCPFPIYDIFNYEKVCREAFSHYRAVKIKAHDGMRFDLSGVVFEILHTPDDDMPAIFKNKNDSSVIIKMTYEGSSMLWLGDMGELPSTSCVEMYGNALKADAMQVSHHGWGAATPEFYDIVRPKVLFWNNSEFGYKYADKYQGYGKTKTSTDLYNMDCVQKNIFCNRIRMTYAYLPIRITEKADFAQNGCKILVSAASDSTSMVALPDNRIIVFDGGFRDYVWDTLDHEALRTKLYEEMRLLSGKEKPTVAAWIVSDATPQRNRFWEDTSNEEICGNMEIEQILYAFSQNDNKELLRQLQTTGADLISAQTGMQLAFGRLQLQVLYASSEDSSLVVRISCDGEAAVFTGKMNDEVSRKLLEEYGEELKCSVVQIANGGLENGGCLEFYQACKAKLQLWNTSEYGFRFFHPQQGYEKTPTSTAVFGLETCRLNVFCDQVKPQIFSFPLREEELEYNV